MARASVASSSMMSPIVNAESVYRLLRFSPSTQEVDQQYIAHFLTPSKVIEWQNGDSVPFPIPVHFFRVRMMQAGTIPSVHHDAGKSVLGAALPALMQMAAMRNTEIYIANRPVSRTTSLFSDLYKAKQKTVSNVLRAVLHENACRLRLDILLVVQNVSVRTVALPYESYGGICDFSPCDKGMILVAKVPNEGYHLVGYTENARTVAFFEGALLDRIISKNKHVQQYFSLCNAERGQEHGISNSSEEEQDEDDDSFIVDDETDDDSSQFWNAVGQIVDYFDKRYVGRDASGTITGFQGIHLKPETLAEKQFRSKMMRDVEELLKRSEESPDKTYSKALTELHRAVSDPDEFAKTIQEPVRRSVYSRFLSLLPDPDATDSTESVFGPVLFPLHLDIDMQMFQKAICMFYMDDRNKRKGLQERTLFNQQLKTKAQTILTSLKTFVEKNKISKGQILGLDENLDKFELYTLYGLRWEVLYKNAAQKYLETGISSLTSDEQQYLHGLYLRDSRVSTSIYPIGLFTSQDIPRGTVLGSLSGQCVRGESDPPMYTQDEHRKTIVMTFAGRGALNLCVHVDVAIQNRDSGVLSFGICSAHHIDDVDSQGEGPSTTNYDKDIGDASDSEDETGDVIDYEDEISEGKNEDTNVENEFSSTLHRKSTPEDAAPGGESAAVNSNVMIDEYGNVRTRRRLNAHEQILLFLNEPIASTGVVSETERSQATQKGSSTR